MTPRHIVGFLLKNPLLFKVTKTKHPHVLQHYTYSWALTRAEDGIATLMPQFFAFDLQ